MFCLLEKLTVILTTFWLFQMLECQQANRQHRSLLWRDFITKSLVMSKSNRSSKLKSGKGLQLWKTWIMMWTSLGLGKALERI
jgi:hypothetical protein